MKVLLNKFSAVAIIQCIKEIGGDRVKFLLTYLDEANFSFYKRIPHLVFTHCDTGFHHLSVKKCTLCVYNTHVHGTCIHTDSCCSYPLCATEGITHIFVKYNFHS